MRKRSARNVGIGIKKQEKIQKIQKLGTSSYLTQGKSVANIKKTKMTINLQSI